MNLASYYKCIYACQKLQFCLRNFTPALVVTSSGPQSVWCLQLHHLVQIYKHFRTHSTASSRPNLQALQNTQHQPHEEKRTQKCHAPSCILGHSFQTYIVTYLFVYYFDYGTICEPEIIKCTQYVLQSATRNIFKSASMFKIW